jgi:hypothetical protein
MIEWVYKRTDKVVVTDEELWSDPMQKWVPIGHPALLNHVDKTTYTWLTPKGLFHARVDAADGNGDGDVLLEVVPRECR